MASWKRKKTMEEGGRGHIWSWKANKTHSFWRITPSTVEEGPGWLKSTLCYTLLSSLLPTTGFDSHFLPFIMKRCAVMTEECPNISCKTSSTTHLPVQYPVLYISVNCSV